MYLDFGVSAFSAIEEKKVHLVPSMVAIECLN
jgi:hypothetical protein